MRIDHLVVAARTLDEGAAWVESKLGVAPVPGGKHPVMGTHNRLLFIGPGRFLEVIAVDPDAEEPGRARWFDLDDPAMRARIARAPELIHWVERTDDIDAALRQYAEPVEVLSLARGNYRWRIGVPRDGRRPGGGTLPTLIQWEGGCIRPMRSPTRASGWSVSRTRGAGSRRPSRLPREPVRFRNGIPGGQDC